MEHIEQAGIHSGDSACAIPPHSLSPELVQEVRRQAALLARRLGVCGLMNVQFAMCEGVLYVLEVNPRASRTVPFVSKATGVPWAKVATAVMLGRSLRDVLWERGVARVPRAADDARSRCPSSRSTGSRARTRCSAPRCAARAR